jgi:hypothetical protein
MSETVLLGRGREIIEIPRQQWESHLTLVPQHTQSRLSFMSEVHHTVRYFLVRELPRFGSPLSLEFISQELNLPIARTQVILDELERNLFFLVRDEEGAVSWAYPVTVDSTPHQLSFSSGERLFAA